MIFLLYVYTGQIRCVLAKPDVTEVATVANTLEYVSVVSPDKTVTQDKIKLDNDINGSYMLATTFETEEDFHTIRNGHTRQVTADYIYPNRDTPENEGRLRYHTTHLTQRYILDQIRRFEIRSTNLPQ